MADEDGDVGVVDVLVHDHVIALGRKAQVDQVLVVLGVVARDLAAVVELAEQLVAQNLTGLLDARAGVQAVGEQQQHIIVRDAVGEQLVQAHANRHATVRGRLRAALYDVGDDDDHLGAGMRKVGQGLHANRVAHALERGGIQGVPILREALGVLDRLARDEHIGAIGQVGGHLAGAIFEFELHELFLSLNVDTIRPRTLRPRPARAYALRYKSTIWAYSSG